MRAEEFVTPNMQGSTSTKYLQGNVQSTIMMFNAAAADSGLPQIQQIYFVREFDRSFEIETVSHVRRGINLFVSLDADIGQAVRQAMDDLTPRASTALLRTRTHMFVATEHGREAAANAVGSSTDYNVVGYDVRSHPSHPKFDQWVIYVMAQMKANYDSKEALEMVDTILHNPQSHLHAAVVDQLLQDTHNALHQTAIEYVLQHSEHPQHMALTNYILNDPTLSHHQMVVSMVLAQPSHPLHTELVLQHPEHHHHAAIARSAIHEFDHLYHFTFCTFVLLNPQPHPVSVATIRAVVTSEAHIRNMYILFQTPGNHDRREEATELVKVLPEEYRRMFEEQFHLFGDDQMDHLGSMLASATF